MFEWTSLLIDFDAYARDLVADWPPLTAEQRSMLAALFGPASPTDCDERQEAA